MRKILRKIDRRFQLSRPNFRKPGSVLILVVALLVLMALIGTAFLSTQRGDRYNSIQHTNNTEIDLLLEGVKNMAKATIVGSLNDPSLPFPYRPANSTIAKNWDAYDLYHQYTTDPLITRTPNDAWLSPRCPAFHTTAASDPPLQAAVPPASPPGVPVWSCIGQPLTGNTFESPFVLPASGSGGLLGSIPLTYTDRMTVDFVPPTTTTPTPTGSILCPSFATIPYPDGTSATFPAFRIKVSGTYYTYLAGDADGDGMADSGMFKLPVGPINGITYYAGVRIVDNCAAVNVNTAGSRRYDLTALPVPTRDITVTTPATVSPLAVAVGTYNFNGIYNLGCFESNVGLAELMESYDGNPVDNATGSLGSEFATWNLGNLLGNSGTLAGVVQTAGVAPSISPTSDINTSRADFAFTTLGDLETSQIARRPGNPGYVSPSYLPIPASDTDAAALVYHFIFTNPSASRTPLELALHPSLCDMAPNSANYPPNSTGMVPGPITRFNINGSTLSFAASGYSSPTPSSTSYNGNPGDGYYAATAWYSENFDWANDSNIGDPESCMSVLFNTVGSAGATARCRRSIFTADSAVSNLAPQPLLMGSNGLPTSGRPYYVVPPFSGKTLMSPITSTLCKTSINTAPFWDLWRAFWLTMAGDYGMSPLGTNTGFVATLNGTVSIPNGASNTAITGHDLTVGANIYTGSQFTQPAPDDNVNTNPQGQAQFAPNVTMHPQQMFRNVLRNAVNFTYGSDYYLEADQMVLLRSAIAAANACAMRYPTIHGTAQGTSEPIQAFDIPLVATKTTGVGPPTATPVYARVYGVVQQPYITEVFVNTDTTTSSAAPYVAIELFNPYNVNMSLKGWQLGTIDRSTSSGTPNNRNLRLLTAAGELDSVVLPAYTGSVTGTVTYHGSYALLESRQSDRPPASGLPLTGPPTVGTSGAPIYDQAVTELTQLVTVATNQELVLLRPLNGNGTPEAPIDQVPVDSFDFTGIAAGTATGADDWHYVRANQYSATTGTLFRFIYPGRYDASQASRRQQGTQDFHYNPALGGDTTVGEAVPPPTLGNDNPVASYPVTFPLQYLNSDQPGAWQLQAAGGVNTAPFGQFARNSDLQQVPFVGSYMIFSSQPAGYPAQGAMPGTPYLLASTSNVMEVNPLPMDCSFAEDTDQADDPPGGDILNSGGGGGATDAYIWNESVGHFAPVNTRDYTSTALVPFTTVRNRTPNPLPSGETSNLVLDSDASLAYTDANDPCAPYKVSTSGSANWHYRWASRIFDYLTVQNPNDDFLPNVQPALYAAAGQTAVPVPVQNTTAITTAGDSTATPPSNSEDTVPVYGLININTAPWRVLSALRLCPWDDSEAGANMYTPSNSGTPGTTPGVVPVNTLLAQFIASWRDSTGTAVATQVSANYPYTIYKGPFTSVADILNVPVVQTYLEQMNFQKSSPEPDAVQGHFSPYDFTTAPTPSANGANGENGTGSLLTDGVRNDVEERFDFLSRLSNQITTRSDVYTVYIVIQGWRNAGSTSTTNPPQMVTQKRAAFIIDRTGVTPINSTPKIINVPTD